MPARFILCSLLLTTDNEEPTTALRAGGTSHGLAGIEGSEDHKDHSSLQVRNARRLDYITGCGNVFQLSFGFRDRVASIGLQIDDPWAWKGWCFYNTDYSFVAHVSAEGDRLIRFSIFEDAQSIACGRDIEESLIFQSEL
jgi:hypothetical protein